MKVQRSHITDQEKRFDFTVGHSEVGIPELKDSFTLELYTYAVCENYFTRGKVFGKLSLQCDICLEEYNRKFDREFKLYIKLNTEENDPKDERDIIIIQKLDTVIDYTEYIKDTILLEVPYQKKCKESCKGLCPVCGNNLNFSNCNHQEEKIDPRWEKLKQLKKNLN